MSKSKFNNDFQKLMEAHLIRFKETKQYLPSRSKKAWLYSDLADNLYPPIRHGFLQHIFDCTTPLHDYANHVRSSQAYCINLFFQPLQVNRKGLADFLAKKLNLSTFEIESYEFEYSSEKNLLGEWKSDSNRPEEYVTASDLVVFGNDKKGRKIAVLIEVKFTENGFSECGGFNSGGNRGDLRIPCDNGKLLLTDAHGCYLHGSNGKSKLKRKYFDLVNLGTEFNVNAFANHCPFINNHQCLRNHSLMNSFKDIGYETRFCLVYHEGNSVILDEWKRYSALLTPNSKSRFGQFSGEELIHAVGDKTIRAYYTDRYTLPK